MIVKITAKTAVTMKIVSRRRRRCACVVVFAPATAIISRRAWFT